MGFSSSKRVLITGAAGFVGACLTRALIDEGHDVHAFLRANSNTWRLNGVRHQFTTHIGDLRDTTSVHSAVQESRPDIVFHTATHGAYPKEKNRDAILSTNILGIANLLNALEAHGDCTLINCGSSSEYGWYDRPMRENDPLYPRTDYAVGKAAATLLCQSEAYRGRPIVTVRLFSVYGPWDDPTRLVPYLMDCCRRGESPRVGDGRQPRDFIYVDDVIDLLRIAGSEPLLSGTILNAGTGNPQTTRDMIDTIMAVCGNGLTAH